jgi:hypothetical protein
MSDPNKEMEIALSKDAEIARLKKAIKVGQALVREERQQAINAELEYGSLLYILKEIQEVWWFRFFPKWIKEEVRNKAPATRKFSAL